MAHSKACQDLKKRYKSLLEALYANKGVTDPMKQEARQLYADFQLFLGETAYEMRMTSLERREAEERARTSDGDAKKKANDDAFRIWRQHTLKDSEYVLGCHLCKALADSFLF